MSRGRPAGVRNGEGTTVLAPIKNFNITHETIVHLHMTGWTNDRIAEYLTDQGKSITPTRVSQVLQDPKAKSIVEQTRQRMREKFEESIEEGLISLAAKSVTRLKETLDQDFVPGSDAKKHQDNVSLTLVKGYLPGNHQNENREEAPISSSLAKRFVSALEKSLEAEERQKQNEIIVDEEVVGV